LRRKIIHQGSIDTAALVPDQRLIDIWTKPYNISSLLPVLWHIGVGEGWANILELGTGFCASTSVWDDLARINNGICFTVDDYNRAPKGEALGLANTQFLQARTEEVGTVKLVMEGIGLHEVDVLFIDALHTEEAMERDFLNYQDLVKPEGFIIFHDVCFRDVRAEGPDFWFPKNWPHKYEKITLSFSNGLGMLRKISHEDI
jgi:predicted O-methyltransferase YrrM